MAHNSSNERIGATKTPANSALRLLPLRTLRELCATGLPQPVLDIDTASTAGGKTPCERLRLGDASAAGPVPRL